MWNEGGLWYLRIRTEKINLRLPFPMYVITDLLASLDDLCEVVLPRLGYPNYAQALRAFFAAVISTDMHTPLVQICTEDMELDCRRVW